ncbi:hypothetical protein NDU88_004348 [Pleurodeles waltl]|uniref:Uncharacterized protein n=1 Tax=Pleurodeles waltl TaxID=8319 RepID=A0AAV7UFD0_PLEWA|nr:hypothetical protein NDU88_004348 [Pleurodeles waltl]
MLGTGPGRHFTCARVVGRGSPLRRPARNTKRGPASSCYSSAGEESGNGPDERAPRARAQTSPRVGRLFSPNRCPAPQRFSLPEAALDFGPGRCPTRSRAAGVDLSPHRPSHASVGSSCVWSEAGTSLGGPGRLGKRRLPRVVAQERYLKYCIVPQLTMAHVNVEQAAIRT